MVVDHSNLNTVSMFNNSGINLARIKRDPGADPEGLVGGKGGCGEGGLFN